MKWLPFFLLLTAIAIGESPSLYDEVERLVAEHFYDRTLRGLDWHQLCQQYRDQRRGVEPLLSVLKASHTRYYPADSQAFHELCGIFHGVRELEGQAPYAGPGWFLLAAPDGRTFVKNVWPGFPAERAGLRVGDEVLDVDGHSPWQVSREERQALLHVRRSPGGAREEISLQLAAIDPMPAFEQVERASARLLGNGKIAYVAIPCYAGDRFQDALQDVLSESPLREAEGLIVDLRDGWGGANPAYLNLFNGRVPRLELRFPGEPPLNWDRQWRKPVVFLVNGGTTSGKEILAYGLQKYAIGKVVGEPTAGAVLGGRPYPLKEGGLLYLAVADALVDGQRLEGKGVRPDLLVERAIPYCQGRDPQLEAALALLTGSRKTSPAHEP